MVEAMAAPRVTFIIAAREARHVRSCVERLELVHLPDDGYEVLLAIGHAPAAQRNAAAARARGEVLYFLDDDSLIDPTAPAAALDVLTDPDIAAVGGPAEPHDDGRAFTTALSAAMTSSFGMGPAWRRYRADGDRRVGAEWDIIGCNLAVRADAFAAAGGFDERLFPNEENELIARMGERHAPVVYEPTMRVHRPLDDGPLDCWRRFWRYGRGRMAHFRARPASFRWLFMLPLLWVLTATAAIAAALYGWRHGAVPVVMAAPFVGVAAYALATLAASVRAGRRVSAKAGALAWLPLIFPLLHTAYGLGLLGGLLAPGLRYRQGAPLVVTLKALSSERSTAQRALDHAVATEAMDAG
jgi:succinoglycan biosynthesis protein ExoA